jgi:hypothetical protein
LEEKGEAHFLTDERKRCIGEDSYYEGIEDGEIQGHPPLKIKTS